MQKFYTLDASFVTLAYADAFILVEGEQNPLFQDYPQKSKLDFQSDTYTVNIIGCTDHWGHDKLTRCATINLYGNIQWWNWIIGSTMGVFLRCVQREK